MAEAGHKRCLGCGYILDNLPEPRCPECGRGFDPLDRRTYSIPSSQSGVPLLAAAIMGCLACATPLFFFAFAPVALSSFDPLTVAALVGLCLVGGLVCSLVVIGRALDILRRPALKPIHVQRVRLALLISTFASLIGLGFFAYGLTH